MFSLLKINEISLGRWKNGLLPAAIICLVTAWIYSAAFFGTWLWDDTLLVTDNPVMSDPGGVWKIWFQPGNCPDYYPITFSLFWLEWHLWGAETLGYHLTSIALHVVNACLVWRLFDQLGLKLAWLGGLLFAIHPVQVESVAWIAELKNTLSLALALVTFCTWIEYDRDPKPRTYQLTLGLFLITLLCKITVVMFPVIILLHAWWRRGRIGAADLKASAPFFMLSLAAGLVPVLDGNWDRVFSHLGPEFVPPGGLAGRFALAGQEAAFYFSKSLLPVGLLPVYPKWGVDPFSLIFYLPWIVAAAFMPWFWMRRKTWGRHLLLGLGFFLINLLPCPGFIPGPNMGYAWVMDHFLYLPIIGLVGLAVAGLEVLLRTESTLARSLLGGASVLIMILFAVGSHAYAKLYRNSDSLWTYAARHNPDSWMVHLNLGENFILDGQLPEAIDQFKTALKLDPVYPGIHYGLGNAFRQSGQISDAIIQLEMVNQIAPHYHDVDLLLGLALIEANRLPEAIHALEQSLPFESRNAVAYRALGETLLKTNQVSKAGLRLEQAIALDPSDASAHANLGVALARTGHWPEAAEQFEIALRINPNDAGSHNNLGGIYLQSGRFAEAIGEYQSALRIQPDFALAQSNLNRAEALAKTRGLPIPPK